MNTSLKTLYKYFSVFYNIRDFVNKSLIKTIYFACIFSRVKYGIEIYGSCNKTLMNKLQTTQNKLLRILTRKDRMYGTDALHNELEIFKIKDTYEMYTLFFVYNCLHSHPVEYFDHYFFPQNDRHQYNTRQQGLLEKHRIHTELGRSTTHFTGATLWNQLPKYISEITKFSNFKKEITSFYRSIPP